MKKIKSPNEQRKVFNSINKFYDGRKNVIRFFDDFITTASEARDKAIKGAGTKTLTPKKMLQ